MRRFLHENGLSLVALGLFLVLLLFGQGLAGERSYNEEREERGQPRVSLAKYYTTAHFGEATFENWESEFLQMGAYVLLTVRLRQKGSAESKKLDEEEPADEPPEKHRDDSDAPWPVRRGGVWLALYKNSLSLAFVVLFLGAWMGHAVTGAHEYSEEQIAQGGSSVTGLEYVTHSRFWFESMQNWQSEVLAVGAIVVLSIYLRQQGSPESKPVHAPHAMTGTG